MLLMNSNSINLTMYFQQSSNVYKRMLMVTKKITFMAYKS